MGIERSAGMQNVAATVAAAALYVAPRGPTDFGDAIELARGGIRDGAGLRALDRLRSAHRSPGKAG